MTLQRFAVRLAISTILSSAVWAAVLALAASGCQSAEQRQANELREALLELVDEIEQLDQEQIAALRERKGVIDASPPARGPFGVRRKQIDEQAALRNVESAEKRHSERLAELRQRVEEYTDPELPTLALVVRAARSGAADRIKSAQKKLQQAQERKKAAEERAAQAAAQATSQKKLTPKRSKPLLLKGPSFVAGRQKTKPPAESKPSPEELRQSLSKRIDEVDQLYDQWINELKAVQEAQTDRWQKRWAGDAVTMALLARKQDIPRLRARLETSKDSGLDRVESGVQFQKAMVEEKLAAAREKLKSAQQGTETQ